MVDEAPLAEPDVGTARLAGRRVAIIDDAFIAPALERVGPDERDAVQAALSAEDIRAELAGYGFPAAATTDDVLEALTDPDRLFGLAVGAVLQNSEQLGRMIQERHFIRSLVRLIEEHTGNAVVACDPRHELPDLAGCDLILVDYYLEGNSGTGDLAKALARQVHRQAGRPAEQQIVLMSSFENVRVHRAEFRSDAELSGASFAFVAKLDMDQRWKVKAHFGMLDRAKPHAPILESYRGQLATSLQQAAQELLQITADLDIGDYAYLQSQALMSDGHPLGDYVSWLLSSHLTTLAFESSAIRTSQQAVDKLEFERKTFAATEPSPIVANLFHSALLSSNQGPLGPHPRAKPDSAYAAFPLVQLGDVFLDQAGTKAVVVLSADCDLAFSPVEARPPNPDTPVILVPGEPKALMSKIDDDVPARTEGIVSGDRVYRIDWQFSGYRSEPLGKLRDWLTANGFVTANRDRLRALYALKLQQEFGAHLLRVGPPVMPPLTFAAEGTVYLADKTGRQVFEEIARGDIMLSHHKGELVARLTPKLVDSLRRAAQAILDDLKSKRARRPADLAPPAGQSNQKIDPDQAKIEALQRELDTDDYWINLVDGVVLNAPGSIIDRGGACSFVRGGVEWKNPSKPRVILEILEKTRPDQESGSAN